MRAMEGRLGPLEEVGGDVAGGILVNGRCMLARDRELTHPLEGSTEEGMHQTCVDYIA